jgi:hypothetical protein
MTRRIAAVCALVLVSAALAACGSSKSSSAAAAPPIPPGPIQLGALYTLSGPTAAFGEVNLKTETALINRLNAQGGIAGHKVELVYLNDQGDPAVAVSAARQLVADHIAAYVYAGTSVTDQQATEVFTKAKIPGVAFEPSDRWDNGAAWPYNFTDYSSFKPQAETLVAFAKRKGVTRLGLLGDTTPFAESFGADVAAAAAADGVTVTKSVSYGLTAVDVTTQLEQLKASGAQGIVLTGETGFGHVYDDLRGIGWAPPIFTTYAAYFVGYSSLGNLAATTWSTCQTDIMAGEGLPPHLDTIVPYVIHATGLQFIGIASVLLNENDSLLILKYGIEHAHTLSGPAVAKAIESIHGIGFTVPSYKYYFSAAHHAGWPASESHMCIMKPLGPYQTPLTAPGS